MEWVINWTFLAISIALFIYWLYKPLYKDWPLVFFLTGYFAIFISVILVDQGWFSFPVRFLSEYFQSSLLYEYFILPVISVLYQCTTYSSKTTGIVGYAILYSLPLTLLEYFFERYTDLINYGKWTVLHTFLSLILFLVGLRYLMALFRIFTSKKK